MIYCYGDERAIQRQLYRAEQTLKASGISKESVTKFKAKMAELIEVLNSFPKYEGAELAAICEIESNVSEALLRYSINPTERDAACLRNFAMGDLTFFWADMIAQEMDKQPDPRFKFEVDSQL